MSNAQPHLGTRSIRILLLALAGLVYWVLARSCDYRHERIWLYAGYVGFFVWFPGHCLLALVNPRRTGWVESLALGLPLGFGFEAAAYIAAAALGLREGYGWMAGSGIVILMVAAGKTRGWRGLWPGVPRPDTVPGLVLAAAMTLAVVTAAARIYAPAPLGDGQMLHSTHHDWVYLLSRAAEIGLRWPFEDPSLSGTPMSYHYLLMVHVAAAANVTGLELAQVMFRLVQVPLSLGLLVQAFALGRRAGSSAAAGAVAAILVVGSGELSWRDSTSGGLFGTLFLEWLYVSPTFFHGMIFMGAVLLWVPRMMAPGQGGKGDWALLFLLAVTATGAKGTVLVPLILALAVWGLVRLVRTRRWPWRLTALAVVLGIGFLVSYSLILRAWSGDDTAVVPLAFSRITAFWQENAAIWLQSLTALGLPAAVAGGLVGLACAGVVFLGNTGVFLFGLGHAFLRERAPEIRWLGLTAAACLISGQMLFLESHAEIYLYLPARLPLAALTGAAAVAIWRRQLDAIWHDPAHRGSARLTALGLGCAFLLSLYAERIIGLWVAIGLGLILAHLLAKGPAQRKPITGVSGSTMSRGQAWRGLLRAGPLLLLGLLAAVQMNFILRGNRSGWTLWRNLGATGQEEGLVALHEALDWVRRETPVGSILLSNAVTPATTDPQNLAILDRTTVDKHYYYSALAERRLWVEGPGYLRDSAEARRRMQVVAQFLQDGVVGPLQDEIRQPSYLVIDRLAPAGLIQSWPGAEPVFENKRATIYRLPTTSGN